MAEETEEVLSVLREKVVTIVVDDAANMEVAVEQLQIRELGCFVLTLNLGAQKIYTIPTISKWSARIRDAIVWIQRSSIEENVFEVKQRLLGKIETQCHCFNIIQTLVLNRFSLIFMGHYVSGLSNHWVVLDVRTRWNSLSLMVERFVEQYPAIQAAFLDARAKWLLKRDR